MRTLAIDTSSKIISVALLNGEEVVFYLDSQRFSTSVAAGDASDQTSPRAGQQDVLAAGVTSNPHKRQTRSARVFPPGAAVHLAPMIKQLTTQNQVSLGEIDLLAIAIGPGSFTGLRAGVVTAKTLAYAAKCDIVAVNTLEIIANQTASQIDSQGKTIQAAINAQRQQLFTRRFQFASVGQTSDDQPGQISDRDQWIDGLQTGDVVTGSGLTPIVDLIRERRPDVEVAPSTTWHSNAIGVGKLGLMRYQSGKTDDFWTLEPFYFRPSTAEEVRAAKDAGPL